MLSGKLPCRDAVSDDESLVGDANRDGEFNQVDIVHVLASAKFHLAGNGDGVFSQKDIIAALVTGNYLQGLYVDALLAGSTE